MSVTAGQTRLIRFWLFATAFLSGAVVMALEILGSRLLAPVFGNSLFVWGALIGAFVGNLAVQWYGARRVGMQFAGGPWLHPAAKEYALLAFPLMLGQSIVAFDEVFMSVFGSMAGEGGQTHLQYARRTMLVPVGLIAQAAGVAAFPFLARLFAAGEIGKMQRTVDRALRYVLAASSLQSLKSGM